MAHDEDTGIERATNEILERIRLAEEPRQLPQDAFTKSMAALGFPLPDNPPARYAYRERRPQPILGTVERAEKLDRKTGQRVALTNPDGSPREDFYPIASPFAVTHSLVRLDSPDSQWIRVRVHTGKRTRDGMASLTFDMPRADLVDQKKYMARLMESGLHPYDKRAVAQIMELALPVHEIVILPQPGWHRAPWVGLDEPIFACPDGEIIGNKSGLAIEVDRAVAMDENIARSGTLDGWKRAAAAVFENADALHLQLGVMAGFAGPILSLLKLPSSGINLNGTTSRGKSTAQALGASVWSTPDPTKPGLFVTARATENGLEPLLARGNGTFLAIDELIHARPDRLGELVFMISGGVGKQRMRADGGLREVSTWETYAMLSFEKRLADGVREGGGRWSPGAELRLLDVNVAAIPASESLEALAKAMKEQTLAHHGHAGPEFVRALFEHKIIARRADLALDVKKRARRIAQTMSETKGDAGAAERAAQGLAVLWIAAELAKRFGLLPRFAEPELAVHWAWQRFAEESETVSASAEDRAIAALELWTAQRWDVTIKKRDGASAGVREAEGWHDAYGVYLPAEKLGEAGGGFLPQKVLAQALDTRGLLVRKDGDGRLTLRYGGRESRLRVYALDPHVFGRSPSAE